VIYFEELTPTISCNALAGISTPQTFNIKEYIKKKKVICNKFHFFVQRGGDMDGYWGGGFLGQGEWNDHEHLRKGGVLGEWKIPFDV
jgi:hypothetical protein